MNPAFGICSGVRFRRPHGSDANRFGRTSTEARTPSLQPPPRTFSAQRRRLGKVTVTTYGQLTRPTHQRLFRLKERIPARYEDVSGADFSARVMQTASQANLGLVDLENQQKDMSTGIYDDGEWMCGDCVSGYAR